MELRGVAEWTLAVEGLIAAADAAARRSVQEGVRLQKEGVQANISGPPRWQDGVHQPRGGGPGILTGRLRRQVGYSRVERVGFGRYSATLRSRAKGYARKTEATYPYFEPGIARQMSRVRSVFERNYRAYLARI